MRLNPAIEALVCVEGAAEARPEGVSWRFKGSAAPNRPRQVNALAGENAPGGVFSGKAAFTLASHRGKSLLDFAAGVW